MLKDFESNKKVKATVGEDQEDHLNPKLLLKL